MSKILTEAYMHDVCVELYKHAHKNIAYLDNFQSFECP